MHRAARREVDRALELDDELDLAWALRGELHAREGDWERALAALDRALELAPDAVDPRLGRAYVHWRIGALVEAQADCDACLELDPEFPSCHVVQSEIHLAGGQPEEALAAAERAAELARDLHTPFLAEALVAIAAANLALGRVAVARADLDRARELHPHILRADEVRRALESAS